MPRDESRGILTAFLGVLSPQARGEPGAEGVDHDVVVPIATATATAMASEMARAHIGAERIVT
jgi:hypothetical protein